MNKNESMGKKIARIAQDKAIMLTLLAMVIIIGIINPRFISIRVLRDVALQNSTKLIMACGMTFILIVGGVDLSAGRVMGFAAVMTASLGQTAEYARKFYPQMGELGPFVPLLAAIAVGAIFGAMNGFIISRFKITAFIVTLGTQVIAWGANLLYFDIEPNSSQPIGGVLKSITTMGSGLIGSIKFPIVLVIAICVCLLTWFILAKTRGGNADAAMVSGIRVQNTQLAVYTLAGAMFGLAGYLECARTGGATSAYGLSYEFDAISACVVGGVSNMGGVGTVPGMVLGVLVFGVINYGLTFIGVNPYWQQIIKGIIIIVAVGLDMSKNRKRK